MDGLPCWWKVDILLTLGKYRTRKTFAAEKFLNTALAERGISTEMVHIFLIRLFAKAYMFSYAHILNNHIPSNFKKIKSFPVGTKVNIKKEDIIPFAASILQHAKTIKDDKEKQGLFNEAFDALLLSLSCGRHHRSFARIAVNDPDLAKLLADIQMRKESVCGKRGVIL